jgi:hypothetical protein
MRKRSTLRTSVVALAAFLGAQAARGSEPLLPAANELSNEMVDRARGDLTRVQELVGDGTLSQASLRAAEARLADVTDQATLTETLYSPVAAADLTPDQQTRMLAAASRRADRQTALVAERQTLLEMGIISKSEMNSVNVELQTRQRVLDLVRDRIRMIATQRQMALEEQNVERALEAAGSHKAMLKFDGNGHFSLGDLPAIAVAFEQKFHYALPVTAHGQTAVHQALGLDHRGKIDVGLNPDLPEGVWLRSFLEDRQIPFIAFRTAIPGAATAPHIHIGTGSSRIGLAQR